MKLATYKDGSRDGQLVVVSRDLSTAHYATGIAGKMQQVLDDWNFLSPQLQDLYVTLNQGKARHAFAFDPRQCMAPLPRAGLWAEGAAPGGNALLWTHLNAVKTQPEPKLSVWAVPATALVRAQVVRLLPPSSPRRYWASETRPTKLLRLRL